MTAIEVKSRSKSIKSLKTDLSLDGKVQELVNEISSKNSISQYRLRLTILDKETNKQKPLDANKSFIANGITSDKVELFVKDLGPQISWRTVFLIEYFGPFIFHFFFYYVSKSYGVEAFEHSQTQQLAFVLVLAHFLKREYETVFVHKFSNATMPAFNIFKNSGHYWILSGFNLAFFIYRPNVGRSGPLSFIFHVNEHSSLVSYALVGLWAFAEISNFITHGILANLRKGDTKRYVIPFGYGFDLVACPNYFFESLAWLAYALLVGNWSAWVFLFVSSGQMWLWAVKKHKRYLQTFGDDYKKLKRKVFIPYVL
ncbi:uncharacterized protein SPAPADRAFT_132798 [Spathaspora passalidarum NRRL Y-27907]|uniref:very-long-chain enoyl-CoA reductase n=1 Tax=Spathaspora passalidarum (strain NRRL Y-27907 / 11-Y1) TaxID=619300 RepID=G3AE00_SPAPN|nr:uncharacterized protein SPAPADRAFT_132798 [Spathaspora passalidarum NRRL Y-27907]EGW34725.1 hypothetical protein SPAPADRAFT_132798 [Spathaspora passalidarum NRRL Y-27907]